MDFLLFVVYRTTWAGGSEESGEDSGDLLGGPSGVRDEPPDATNDGIRQAPVRPHGIAHSWQPQLGNVLLAQIEEQEAPSVPCRNLGRSLVKQRQDFCFYLFTKSAGSLPFSLFLSLTLLHFYYVNTFLSCFVGLPVYLREKRTLESGTLNLLN